MREDDGKRQWPAQTTTGFGSATACGEVGVVTLNATERAAAEPPPAASASNGKPASHAAAAESLRVAAAGLAHRLNNVHQVIRGSLELMLDELGQADNRFAVRVFEALELQSAVAGELLALAEESPAPRPAPVRREAAGSGARLLIVEDDDCARDLMRSMLQTHGFEVMDAPDGFSALELLERTAFDGVISDIQMPRMNGNELMDRLRDLHPRLPVLLISGLDRRSAMAQGHLRRGDTFLQKPFGIDDLLKWVRQVIGPRAG